MKITLVAVVSVDGKTTKWGEPNIYTWTSKEDHDQFFTLIKSHTLIVMGAKTYLAAKSVIKLAPGKMTLVMTRNPKKFKKETIPGQLEFTSDSPQQIIEKFKDTNEELLLTGGGEINSLFLKDHLVNEIILTIEPRLFGTGNNIAESKDLDTNLKLLSLKQLNENGTLLLRYSVIT